MIDRYLEHVFRYAAAECFGVHIPSGEKLAYRQGPRGADFWEATLEVAGEPVLRFARSYGMRSLRGVVSKLKVLRASCFVLRAAHARAAAAGRAAVRLRGDHGVRWRVRGRRRLAAGGPGRLHGAPERAGAAARVGRRGVGTRARAWRRRRWQQRAPAQALLHRERGLEGSALVHHVFT